MAGMIDVMTTPLFDAEQKKVHVALSSFVSSMINSTAIRNVVVNMPDIPNEAVLSEPRKYRPNVGNSPVSPLDLGSL